MTHILITGAAGMIGRKLTEHLVSQGGLNGKSIERLTLLDVVAPPQPAGFAGKIDTIAADLSSPGKAVKAVAERPETIFHLAGVVSGEAEVDFDKGYRVNLDGMRCLLEAIRATGNGYRPKLVYTSSIAVFGAPFPPSIADEFHLTPLTSYGTQKAIGELLLAAVGDCDLGRALERDISFVGAEGVRREILDQVGQLDPAAGVHHATHKRKQLTLTGLRIYLGRRALGIWHTEEVVGERQIRLEGGIQRG